MDNPVLGERIAERAALRPMRQADLGTFPVPVNQNRIGLLPTSAVGTNIGGYVFVGQARSATQSSSQLRTMGMSTRWKPPRYRQLFVKP